jgi:hypothetical protein
VVTTSGAAAQAVGSRLCAGERLGWQEGGMMMLCCMFLFLRCSCSAAAAAAGRRLACGNHILGTPAVWALHWL